MFHFAPEDALWRWWEESLAWLVNDHSVSFNKFIVLLGFILPQTTLVEDVGE